NGSGFPNANDDAVLSGNSGNGYTVTLGVNTPSLASLTINFASAVNSQRVATLAVGTFNLNVTGTVSGATDNINLANQGRITIAGGNINAGNIAFSGVNTALSGFGTLNADVVGGGNGTITASGGTLDLTGTVGSGVTLAIASSAASVLKASGAATA